jgi:hypothetical protein
LLRDSVLSSSWGPDSRDGLGGPSAAAPTDATLIADMQRNVGELGPNASPTEVREAVRVALHKHHKLMADEI